MWRDGVARDLTEAGHQVVATAADGAEAIRRFPAARPDVLVLDLQIPEPNGVAVTAEVIRQNPAVRVLILSASGEQRDVLEAVKAGATGYLVKPPRGNAARCGTTSRPRRHPADAATGGLFWGKYRPLERAPDPRTTPRGSRSARRRS